mmetsp:Transcript_79528/g.125439  ORF Transcript_79528/g.125439 Transcript_79528/m.125439 type:complete len:208 (+) Transcript_79528:883-1506(+)
MGIGCSTYGVIFSTLTSVYAFFCPSISRKKGVSHHSTSGIGSRLRTLGSIFFIPMSFGSSSTSFCFDFCSSSFFFFASFSLSIPRAFSCNVLTNRCSFFTREPSSTNRNVFLFCRSYLRFTLRELSCQFCSVDPSFFSPRIFFSRASFSRLMFTFKVLTTCGRIGTTTPSSSSSRPNSSRMSFLAFGPSPGKKPAARPWFFSFAICS